MNRFDGTAVRQLDLLGEDEAPVVNRPGSAFALQRQVSMRLLRKDVYAELTRRRRQAQISARHELDKT